MVLYLGIYQEKPSSLGSVVRDLIVNNQTSNFHIQADEANFYLLHTFDKIKNWIITLKDLNNFVTWIWCSESSASDHIGLKININHYIIVAELY